MDYDQLSITGPIIIVEDDADDRFILGKIFEELRLTRQVLYFENPILALTHLVEESLQPFIVLSDINLPLMNGLDFKRKIDQNPLLREKSIPFVFFSTAASKFIVKEAYREFAIQGFFQKGEQYEQVKQTLYRILCYWQECKHPNNT